MRQARPRKPASVSEKDGLQARMDAALKAQAAIQAAMEEQMRLIRNVQKEMDSHASPAMPTTQFVQQKKVTSTASTREARKEKAKASAKLIPKSKAKATPRPAARDAEDSDYIVFSRLKA